MWKGDSKTLHGIQITSHFPCRKPHFSISQAGATIGLTNELKWYSAQTYESNLLINTCPNVGMIGNGRGHRGGDWKSAPEIITIVINDNWVYKYRAYTYTIQLCYLSGSSSSPIHICSLAQAYCCCSCFWMVVQSTTKTKQSSQKAWGRLSHIYVIQQSKCLKCYVDKLSKLYPGYPHSSHPSLSAELAHSLSPWPM